MLVSIDPTIAEKLIEISGKSKGEFTELFLNFITLEYDIRPVLYLGNRTIYRTPEEAFEKLTKNDEAYTCIKLNTVGHKPEVDNETTKIFICPFSGKVFGNNMFLHPEDVIYEWVMNCPENKVGKSGMKERRFYVSEDPKLISSYKKEEVVETKEVFKSISSKKLFLSQEDAIEDVKKSLKPMSISEVVSQKKHKLDDDFIELLQKVLDEDYTQQVFDAMLSCEGLKGITSKWESL
eukprot:XP_019928174.1 PREDICTED: uncharacterized protein LOC109620371 [Crassostrea gigas]